MKHPWMPLYIADYLADTSNLRAAESGAYLHLIMHYWQRNGLPDDDRQLAVIARMTAEEWQATRPLIEPLFSLGWRHKRIDKELTKADQKIASRAAAGRRGAEARWDGKSHGKRMANGCQPQPQPERGDGGGDARARDPAPFVSQKAFDFADELAVIVGHDVAFLPPRWVGSGPAMRVEMWLRNGYRVETMRDVARAVMRRKLESGGEPPETVQFFDKIFARAHAPQLPLPAAKLVSTTEGSHGQAQGAGDWRARRDAQHAALDKLRAHVAELDRRGGEEGGEPPLRVVSDAAGSRR